MRAAILIVVLGVVAIVTAVALCYGTGRLDSAVVSTVERYGSAALSEAAHKELDEEAHGLGEKADEAREEISEKAEELPDRD